MIRSETVLENTFSEQNRFKLVLDELEESFDLSEYSEDQKRVLVASTQWHSMPLVSAAASLSNGDVEEIEYWLSVITSIDDFFNIYWDNTYKVSTQVVLDCQEQIENFMYLPPMISKPNKLRKNSDTPRYFHKESLILGHKFNYHEGNISLDVLNRQNTVKLFLDWDFINNYEFDETDELFSRQRKIAHEAIGTRQFYLTNSVDKRGRVYTNGYHINIQGSPEQRACINLVEE